MTLSFVQHGHGAPIVVLHGGGLDHRHMVDAIEPVFARRAGFQRLYVDLPGHGLSDGSGMTSQDDVVDAVQAFCAKTVDRPFALIGESRGSLIARTLVARQPEQIAGVCLIVPGGDDVTSEKPEHQTLVSAPDVRRSLPPEAQGRFDRLVVQSESIAEKIVTTKLPAARLADNDTAARIKSRFAPTTPLEHAPYAGPSLILAGRQDAIAGFSDATQIQTAYPRSTFAIMDMAGHSLSWERPALFDALMQDWLDRLSAVL